MGIFSRLGTLIKSNLNDLISKAEDPEKMLNQVLLEMKNQLVEAKKQVAVAIADEKRLKKQWDEQVALVEGVGAQGDAGGARRRRRPRQGGAARKKEHDDLQRQFEQQWHLQKHAVDKLKDQLRMLNDKIEEAKRKKNILIARAEARRGAEGDPGHDARPLRHQRVRHLRAHGREGRPDRGRGRGVGASSPAS